jgi:hypothetical protein
MDEKRKIYCPYPDSADAWVELPPVWLGKHLLRRDAAIKAAERFGNGQITVAAIALCIAEDWGGIPGLEGKSPEAWDFSQVPIGVLVWLQVAVFSDFQKAFTVPKVPSSA